MTAMELLTGSAAQAIGWALLHLLWQATIVAGILAAVLAMVPRESANARYAASCGALALVFAMFVTTTIRSYDPAAAPVQTAMVMVPGEEIVVPLTQIPAVIVATAAASWRDRAIDAVTTARQSLPSVVAFWFVGVVFLSSRLIVSWIRARSLLYRGAVEAGREWQRVAARLSDALGLKRAVRLLESAAVEVPSVIGTLRPVILLPASTLTGLTPEQLEMVLAHELAHIRRHDFLINLLQAFVETLMFFHPAVWWMSRRVRIERENCCDDMAVAVCGNPLQYAKALTRLEELRASALPVVVAANGGSLLDRIRRIAGGRPEATGASSRWAAAIATLAIIALVLAVPSLPAFAKREAPAKEAASKIDVVSKSDEPEVAAADTGEEANEDLHDDDVAHESSYHFHFGEDDSAPVPPRAPMPPRPAMAPLGAMPPMPPMPPMAPMPPAVMAGLHDIDFDFDFDAASDDQTHVDEDEEDGNNKSDKDKNRRRGANGQLSVEDLIALRATGTTPEFIRTMRGLFPSASIGEISGLRAVDVTPEFVKQMRDAGLKVKNASEATGLKAVGVTPEFIREMRAAGLAVTDGHQASGLAAVGVTPKFISDMRAAGLAVKSAHEASGLRAVGVTPEFIRELRDAGVKIDNANEATGLRAVGVTPEFVKKLAAAGYTNLSAHELSKLAAHGIDDDFIRDMQKYRDDK
jgi:beta-lactamase regulating signal transducer with metallopeptidase domain